MATTFQDIEKSRLRIKPHLTCPHCWHVLHSDQILFISESPDLMGDSKLGDYKQLRFLPLRFNVVGAALDAHGMSCDKLACPRCHLPIPRPLLYMPNFFLSIVGAPASGKSYFLASMVWQLRKTMANNFCMSFTDADAAMNKRIRDYESMQFIGDDDSGIVAIEKTDTQGDIYNMTRIDGQDTLLAQPFVFTISPTPDYPFPKRADQVAQAVCLYDNAGESFLPGADLITQPVTRHLATSDAILFLFDPTQDSRFKKACRLPVDDPQMAGGAQGGGIRKSPVRQETVLNEMISRVRSQTRLPPNVKHKAPLIVVLTKYDAWKQLLEFPKTRNPWNRAKDLPLYVYNVQRVDEYSRMLRKLILDLIPDLVSTAETFSENVTYIAVSATGGPPALEVRDGVSLLGYRSGEIHPFWVEVPFFHAQAKTGKYCIPVVKTQT